VSSDLDMLALIDALDGIVHDAKPVPLTDQVRIDRKEAVLILDRMREALPDTIRAARAGREERPERPVDSTPTVMDVAEAARELPALVERVKFGGERFRLDAHGMPMAELRPTDD